VDSVGTVDSVDSVGTALKTPTPQAAGQGVRMEATEKAGLADIENMFDLDASLLDNILKVLSNDSDNQTNSSYYSGGKVAPSDELSELLRLLRG
jgi:hypothetical protein